jgi:hypothetical protein
VDGEGQRADRLTLAEILDAAEALWLDEIRERTLVERQVTGARMAFAEEWDPEVLPDLDKAMELHREWLHGPIDSADDLTPEDEQRLALGLGRKR